MVLAACFELHFPNLYLSVVRNRDVMSPPLTDFVKTHVVKCLTCFPQWSMAATPQFPFTDRNKHRPASTCLMFDRHIASRILAAWLSTSQVSNVFLLSSNLRYTNASSMQVTRKSCWHESPMWRCRLAFSLESTRTFRLPFYSHTSELELDTTHTGITS